MLNLQFGTLLMRTDVLIKEGLHNHLNKLVGCLLLVFRVDENGIAAMIVDRGPDTTDGLAAEHGVNVRFLEDETYFTVCEHPGRGSYDCTRCRIDLGIIFVTWPLQDGLIRMWRKKIQKRVEEHIFGLGNRTPDPLNLTCVDCVTREHEMYWRYGR